MSKRGKILLFRSEPLGTVTFDAALPPVGVIANLRAREREWRELYVPAELKKVGLTRLGVTVKASSFEMQWLGNISPLYNPVLFGVVQPYGEGSRIRAGFKLSKQGLSMLGIYTAMGVINLFGGLNWFRLALSWSMLGTVAGMAFWKTDAGPARAELIEVLQELARERTAAPPPFTTMLSTNGP
jgi:hypothetical protein